MESTPDVVMALALQLAEQMVAARAAQDAFSWLSWVLGFSRKIVECGLVVLFAFWFLAFLDRRNAKRSDGAGFTWVLSEIRKGNAAVAKYFGWRYASTILAMAIVWAF